MANNDKSPFNTESLSAARISRGTIQKCIEAIQDAIGHKRLIVTDGGSNDERGKLG